MQKQTLTELPIDALVPYARNARTHSEAQVAQIAGSIREFGFLAPVLIDGDNGIIAGHGRVMAARMLGMDKVPCVVADHLTETQKRAYIIADNKLALNAGWDDELLALELQDIIDSDVDVDLTGFDVGEIEELLGNAELNIEPASSAKEINPDEYEMANKCPKCGFEYD